MTKPNDPAQVQKDTRKHEQMMEQMAWAEEQRIVQGRAKARRLLLAAGAKQ